MQSSLAAGHEDRWMDDVSLYFSPPVPRPSLSISYYIRKLRKMQLESLYVKSICGECDVAGYVTTHNKLCTFKDIKYSISLKQMAI